MTGDLIGSHTTGVDDEQLAVAAHWLLGRLGVVNAVLARADRLAEIDPNVRAVLLDRSQAAISDIQSVLEDLTRGIPPLLPKLMGDVPQIVDDGT